MPKRTEYQIWFKSNVYRNGTPIAANARPTLAGTTLKELVAAVAKRATDFTCAEDTWLATADDFVIVQVEFETEERVTGRSVVR